MSDFDDLPGPNTVQQRAAAARAQRDRFVRDCETLFMQIATKLQGVSPSAEILIRTEAKFVGNWFSGRRFQETRVTERGWKIGYVDRLADCGVMAYLKPNGAVHPHPEAGVRALLDSHGDIWRRLASVENSHLVYEAREIVIQELGRRYERDWCLGP
jgi:hypothetical protein